MVATTNHRHAAIGSTGNSHRDTETQRRKTVSAQKHRSIRRRGPATQAHRAAGNGSRRRTALVLSAARRRDPFSAACAASRRAVESACSVPPCLCGWYFCALIAYTWASTFSRNTRLARALAVVSSGVAPILQHSTMIGPSKPAPFRVWNTRAKSTRPVPN